jgi:hypothetical protein
MKFYSLINERINGNLMDVLKAKGKQQKKKMEKVFRRKWKLCTVIIFP